MFYENPQHNEIIKLLKKIKDISGNIIENGCWEGESTYKIANECYPEILICNDTWMGNIAESKVTGVEHSSMEILKQKDIYNIFINNMNNLTRGNYTIVKKDCIEWLKHYNEPIKFIYIDASHDYQSVYETINLVLPNIVKGGIICGDDFLNAHAGRSDLNGGVERAVREIFTKFTYIDNLWYWINE